MEQKGITNQLFASSTLSIKQEVPKMGSKDVPNQLSAPLSSINIKHEVYSTSPEWETEVDSKDITGYNTESTCIKTEHTCLPFLHDSKDHLKVDSMNEDGNSHNLYESSLIVSTESNVTEPTTSGSGHVKTEKSHNLYDAGTDTGVKTESDTTGHFVQSCWSDTNEESGVLEIDNILPGYLEAKLLESAGSTLRGELKQKNIPNLHHNKEKSYQCEICHKSFTLRTSLYNHHQGVHKKRQFQCHICLKSFTMKQTLNIHLQSVHTDARPYQCNICHTSFTKNSNLIRHKLTHTKDTFQCDICQKSFSRNDNLTKHYQSVHNNIRPYQCDICQKSFYLNHHLKQHHQSVHSNNRPYLCDVCNKGFTRNSNLLCHKLTHTKEKVFKCDLCQKSFSRNSSLKRHHQQAHSDTKLFQCDICNKAFFGNSDLLRHKLTHTKEKQLQCDICQQLFTLKGNLKKHHKRVHSD